MHNSDNSPLGGGRDVHNSDNSLPVRRKDVHNSGNSLSWVREGVHNSDTLGSERRAEVLNVHNSEQQCWSWLVRNVHNGE